MPCAAVLSLRDFGCLNESPSKKEGKSSRSDADNRRVRASMKALPKRKGNLGALARVRSNFASLNESPSKKEGKYITATDREALAFASMKALPKRKGNDRAHLCTW